MKTELCTMLGIEYPIIQGGMAWVATAELAAAVSEAGGLGIIGAGNAPVEVVRREIQKARALTNKPFGVNVYFISPFVEQIIDLVIEERIPVITTGAGNPGKYMPRLKAAGTKVIPVVASVVLAQRLERAGVDAVIAEGMECGGHIGEITTMALVPQIVDAVSIPVIAAGGIADGRGLAAALALGAVGVQVGTRFVCAEECIAHPNFKQAVIKAKDRSTVITGRSVGHPVRVIENRFSREVAQLEKTLTDLSELDKIGSGKLRSAVIDGDVDNGSLMAGQVAAMVKKVEPAREIILDIVQGADRVIADLAMRYLGTDRY